MAGDSAATEADSSTAVSGASTSTAAATDPADGSTSTGDGSTATSDGSDSASTSTADAASASTEAETSSSSGDTSASCPGFSLEWCGQDGTRGQETRCESIDGWATCVRPWIRYGGAAEGVPGDHPLNDYEGWCAQLGYVGFVAVEIADRSCPAPAGRVVWGEGYDEPGGHWLDYQDGFWAGEDALGYQNCGDAVERVECL
jgi:hypothetical protein